MIALPSKPAGDKVRLTRSSAKCLGNFACVTSASLATALLCGRDEK